MKSQTNLWLRSKARRIIDSCFCSFTKGVQHIGDQNSGWTIQTRPPPRVAHCAGVGKGITFKFALASIPSCAASRSFPTGVDAVRELDRSNSLHNVEFFPVGLAAIMDRRGDTSINLLKTDIQGFEYDMIDPLLNDKIPVRQICAEFHP